MIDEGSASASEIVAGAIQDWDRGLIVGKRSYGKGLVQEQMTLNDESALRLTVAKYYTPSGRYIQRPYKGEHKTKYYLDVFLEAAASKIPVMLWYGFNTRKEQQFLHKMTEEKVDSHRVLSAGFPEHTIHAYEVVMTLMQEEEITYNPGILGCGLMVCNLSERSMEILPRFQKEIVALYRGSKVKKLYPGDLISVYHRFN